MIDKIDFLPPIPVVAQRILSIKLSTDAGEQALYKIIEKDPSIMSKIIGLSNSPIYGAGRKILTLHDAAALLGTKRIKMIALSLSMMSSVEKKPKSLFDINGLWKHSLTIALIMDTIARYMPKDQRPPEDEIYLAGLLHDIGYLALSYIDPQLSDQFCMSLASEPNRSVEEIEAEMLEMNHSDLGAELAKYWGLPKSIIAVIRGHHNPKDIQEEAHKSMIAISALAAKLLPTFRDREIQQANIAVEEWISLGIDPIFADEIKAKVTTHTVQVNGISI